MGAGQSADAGPRNQNVNPIKVSHYELLGVEKQATDDEIKKAYRRKALELHPDRNYGDVERSTTLFAEIQSAYEVLSDPQERAWYDTHEDAILRGGDPTQSGGADYEHDVGLTTAEDITNLMGRFNGRVEFTDAPSGFFGYLREMFEKLSKEEVRAAMQQDLEPMDYPSFGHKDDTHEDVVRPFYAYWAGFSSKKSFSWRDKYSMRDAEDRRMRRLIEKENKKFRDEALREFNDAVRSLVAFVRKRDPRYKPNTQSEEERQRGLRDATAAQAARTRAANMARMDAEVLPDWAKTREPNEQVEIEDEESEEEQFECVACRKTFKSEKQFEAHEKSKKHQKSVLALRRQLQKEGIHIDVSEDQGSGFDQPVAAASDVTKLKSDPTPAEVQVEKTYDLADHTNDLDLGLDFASPEHSENSIHRQGNSEPEGSDAESAKSSTTLNNLIAQSTSKEKSSAEELSLPKLGKAAQKRAKKAAQQQSEASPADQTHICAVCNAAFPSKTRLFQHINDLKHAAPVSSVPKVKGKRGKGK